ncbi:MAG: hypothetical protein ACP5U0_08055, partial [Caldisphaera sp.]
PGTDKKITNKYIMCERCLYVGGTSVAETLRELNKKLDEEPNNKNIINLIKSLKDLIKHVNIKIIK